MMIGSRSGRRVIMTVLVVVVAGLVAAAPASALSEKSRNVAIILGGGTESAGTLQTSGVVDGSPADSFEQFSFTDLEQESIEPAVLARYDTVVLNQVFTSSLSEAQKQALSSFVTSGGKLIIHDADGTEGNDYSWLPVPAQSGASCENCGHTDGEAEIVENNTLVSNEPSSPYYVDVHEFPGNSDAVGDANVLVTSDPRWDEDIVATNDQEVGGLVDGYAADGGLIIYNGFDTDDIGVAFPSGNDWLDKLWYNELAQQWDPDNLPHSNPAVGASGHCGYHTVKVGVVVVCAESVSGTSNELTASGNVVLDGGVGVGNGPVTIDEETKEISTATPAAISLLRSGGPVSLGNAAFSIECAGTADPISGKGGLAKVSLTGASLGPLGTLRVGGIPFSIATSGSVALYLDGEMGGGLIGAASLDLSMLGKAEDSGSLSLGFYAGSKAPVVALGGSVKFGAISLGKGWKFEGLELSYQEPTDTWTASGGLEVPIGSLHASGSLVGGSLNSLQVSIGGANVPLGDSGFFFSEFGGGFSGLATGPLKIDASTAGYWGVPKLPFEPFYLDNVAVTVNFGGSVSLDGAVSLALKEHSPLHGQLHLQLGLNPFSAVGTASIEGSLPGVSLKASGGAGFTSKHFTAVEGGSLKLFGLSGSGEVIVSDKGMGASGTVCGPFHAICKTMALAGTWSQIGKLDVPAILGGEPSKLITVSGVTAAGESATLRVPRGRSALLLAITASEGAPEVTLRAPNSKIYSSGRSTRSVIFTSQPQFGLLTVAVLDPRAGRWHLTSTGTQGLLRVSAQTVGSLRLIRTSPISAGGSKHHPLGSGGSVLLRWNSSDLPPEVRISILRRSQPYQEGVGIAGNLGASGEYRVPVSKLASGRNYLSIAATLHGVPFQQIAFHGEVWRAAPRHHRSKRR